MNCTTCIKLNPLPTCTDTEGFDLSGLTFPDYIGEVIMARFKDSATGRVENLPLVINGSGEVTGGFDIASIMPLMNHWYKIEFFHGSVPANFILTNPDATTETGCCLEFEAVDLTASDGWELTSQGCAV